MFGHKIGQCRKGESTAPEAAQQAAMWEASKIPYLKGRVGVMATIESVG